MHQYKWLRDEYKNIIYDYSDGELERRKRYLLEIDKFAKASKDDLDQHLIPGRSVICWGAGSGKTTAVRQFICENWSDGIIYACLTKKEADLIAYDISSFIGKDYVLCIHNDSYCDRVNVGMTAEGEFVSGNVGQIINQYPETARNYPVIVVTHSRLVNDPPSSYVAYESPFSVGRKYTFIDEKISYEKIQLTSSQYVHVSYSTGLHTDWKRADKFFLQMYNSEDDRTKNVVRMVVQILSNKNEPTNIDLLKVRRTIATTVLNETFVGQKSFKDPMTWYYHAGLIQSEYTVILDGTGDLLYKNSELWTIIKPKKFCYNFKGTIKHIPLRLGRDINKVNDEELISTLVPLVREKTNKGKVLIVTWKSLKGEVSLLDNDVIYDKVLPTEDFVYWVKSNLVTHNIDLDKVEMTYYQSGETRATSKFIDCNSIIFVGSFFIPNYAIADYNNVTHSSITSNDYTLAEIVQATFRTSIRKGKEVDVIFLGDEFRQEFIYDFKKYVNCTENHYIYVEEDFKELDLRLNFKRDLVILANNYPCIVTEKKLVISLNKIYEVLPKCGERKIRSYSSLVESLGSVGITLAIGNK